MKRLKVIAMVTGIIVLSLNTTMAIPLGTATAKGTVPKDGITEAEVNKKTGTGTMEVTSVEVKDKDGHVKRVSYTVKQDKTTSPTVVFEPPLENGDKVTVTLTTSRGTTFDLGLTLS